MGSRDGLKKIDTLIAGGLRAVDLVDRIRFPGREDDVDGYFNDEFEEEGGGEDAVAMLSIVFDCRAEDVPSDLEAEDVVTVLGQGEYRFLRDQPYGNGRTLLILGTVL